MRHLLLIFTVVLLLSSSAALAENAIELSVVQRAFVGDPFIGTIGSLRLGCVKFQDPIGKIDVFADAGARFSETTEAAMVGGLVGASVGQRDKALRFGAGYAYPGSFTVYMRASFARW